MLYLNGATLTTPCPIYKHIFLNYELEITLLLIVTCKLPSKSSCI